MLDKPLSPITRNNKGQFVKGSKLPEDWNERNRLKQIGVSRPHKARTKKLLSKIAKKTFNTPEYKAKISAIRKQIFSTPEMRAKQSEKSKRLWKEGKLKGHKLTKATREKISKAQRGRTHSFEQNKAHSYKLFIKTLDKRQAKELEDFKKQQAKNRLKEIQKHHSSWKLISQYRHAQTHHEPYNNNNIGINNPTNISKSNQSATGDSKIINNGISKGLIEGVKQSNTINIGNQREVKTK